MTPIGYTATQYRLITVEAAVSELNERNRNVVEEFRANGGKVGGRWEGRTLLLLHTIGAKSGQERVNPVAYVRDGDHFVVIASKGGAPNNPDWFYNLRASPDVTVEVGSERFQVHARVVADEAERRRLYDKMVEVAPGFADYERKTTRKIPVIVLERAD